MTKKQKAVWVARLTLENPHMVLLLASTAVWRTFNYGCIQLNRRVLTRKVAS